MNTLQLKPHIPRAFKPVEYLSLQELQANTGGTLLVDCEVYSNYFLVAFKCWKTKKYFTLETSPDTYFNVRLLSWILHNYTTVGFNSNNFDLPLLWLMYAKQNTKLAKDATNKIIFEGLRRWDFEKEYKIKVHPTSHIDLIEVCPLKGSLKTYGARLHSPRIQELPYEESKALTREEANEVKHYCFNDLDNTEILLEGLIEELKLRVDLSQTYNKDLLSKSNAQLSEAIIASELKKLTGKAPANPKIFATSHKYQLPPFIRFQTKQLQNMLWNVTKANFEVLENGRVVVPEELKTKLLIGTSSYRMGNGGLHSCEENVTYKADSEHGLYDRDVSSYYPKIVLNQKLFPKHLGEDFSFVYNAIYERRMAAKKAKRHSDSETLKIALNGGFGKTGNVYSILYAPEMMIQITVSGQLCLLMLIEAMELAGIKCITANTDGVVMKCPKALYQTMLNIASMWEQHTGFETEETEYASYHSRDVNNYIAVKKDGKVKGKGAYLNPWHGSQDIAKLGIFRFHKNPMTTICIEAATQHILTGRKIEETIRASTDIREFVAIQNVAGGAHKNGEYLGKVVRWYYAIKTPGYIHRIKTNNIVSDTLGAKPCLDLPSTFPTDINYDWYIEKANSILDDVAFNPRQPSFFD